jgi:hypothetical protein
MEINQVPYSLYRTYSEDVMDYQESFQSEFGFYPARLETPEFTQLEPYQQKLLFAFWNQKEVVIASTLMDVFYDVCNEIDSRIQ